MFKKLLIISLLLIIFKTSYAEEQKIVFLNVDTIMQQSTAGTSIKKQLENIYKKNLEIFRENDEILKKKEKKIIAQKNILSKEDFQKEFSALRLEIIKFQKEQVKARDDLNKLRMEASNKLITKLSPILKDYAEQNSISLILQKKNIVMGKKEIEITAEILSIANKEIKQININ